MWPSRAPERIRTRTYNSPRMTDTATTMHDEQLLIGGAWREAASGDRFDVTDPVTLTSAIDREGRAAD